MIAAKCLREFAAVARQLQSGRISGGDLRYSKLHGESSTAVSLVALTDHRTSSLMVDCNLDSGLGIVSGHRKAANAAGQSECHGGVELGKFKRMDARGAARVCIKIRLYIEYVPHCSVKIPTTSGSAPSQSCAFSPSLRMMWAN
jgi:hypothetical protein